MTTEASARRRRRAATVVRIAELRDASRTADDPRWRSVTWQSLDALPDWCALDPAARRERTVIAGAVVLLPAIRRCLRGSVLLRLRELIGAARLEALQRRPYRAAARDVELVDAHGLEDRLALHGLRALVADVPDPVARALLFVASSAARPDAARAGTEGGIERDPVGDIDSAAGRIAAGLHALPAG